ncbi:FAD-binding-3 domain-containing protein [Mycena chlorophos]|uniref:FAD-binding-3 domain-containing protein n=1 Tax=Mycena chlorophos TaxID=658473 RepID=A0A8H6WJJ7_MYCCL|nr:FAD-binding-3 domain-containing protein [Mycena chlorophos]
MSTPSVLISGAGPSGLVLAIILVQSGISVRIIEKQTHHPIGSRGTGVQPRTLELYDILGCLPAIEKAGTFSSPVAKYKPGVKEPIYTATMSEWVEPSPCVPHSHPILLPQYVHEQILRDRLAAFGCTVELGSELRSFEQHLDHVVAHITTTDAAGQSKDESATFKWLVGTDGARSSVRKQLGIGFPGKVLTEGGVVIGDIVVEDLDGLERGMWHQWSAGPNKFVYLRSNGKYREWMFTCPRLREDTTMTREEFIEYFYSVSERRGVKFGEMSWVSNYRPSGRIADSLRSRRVFIAGDAAHVHSPTGGQGLNSSVQDSFNLGWKLALVETGAAPDSLLDSYDDERRPVIRQMLAMTSDLLRKTVEQIESKDDSKLKNEAWKRGGRILDAGQPSPTAAYSYKSGERVRAAYRAPDASELVLADGTETTFFHLFSMARHTILVFGTADAASVIAYLLQLRKHLFSVVRVVPKDIGAAQQMVDGVTIVRDTKGYAHDGYILPTDQSTIVVVRPDAVVGAVVFDASGVDNYLKKVFT